MKNCGILSGPALFTTSDRQRPMPSSLAIKRTTAAAVASKVLVRSVGNATDAGLQIGRSGCAAGVGSGFSRCYGLCVEHSWLGA
jgi:hypothetical protein